MSLSYLPAFFTSGPIAVFVVFLLPWGPGAPVGIVLARKDGVSPALTILLYVLSDVVTAFILDPLVRQLQSRGERSEFGRRLLGSFNKLGRLTQVSSGRFGLPFSLFIFTFATDFFTASVVSLGLPLGRVVAWLAIIAGDVIWFLIIFAASIGFASFLSDDRVLFIATMAFGLIVPALIRRLVGERVG
ncbi:MAG TPA: hypothetical protein VNG11_00340 [Chloroflexota bacterium]|nr:hypothetical protein [Chloroflexota bacterium]